MIEPKTDKQSQINHGHWDGAPRRPEESVRRTGRLRLPPAASFTSSITSVGRPLEFFTRNVHHHPDIFRAGLLGFSAYVIHCPEFIRHVLSTNSKNYMKFEKYRYLRFIGGNGLITNEGESWIRQRRLIQPAFNHAALAQACNVILEETQEVVDRLSRGGSQVVDLGELMARLTVSIVARALFGNDLKADVPFIRRELDLSERLGTVLLRTPLPLYSAVPYLPVFNRIARAGDRLRALVSQIIGKRRASAETPGDLLDRLIAARDEENIHGMTTRQLMDEVLTLLVAGHQTSLMALTWAFYLVARHRDIYDGLRDEAVSGPTSVGADLVELDQLPWARAVAREAMRLYPPAYIIGRSALAEDALGEYVVPAGLNVMINIYGLHRHPKYWEAAEEFRPARMLQDHSSDPARFTYLPFGAGPRSCIGARFALFELQLVLSQFARAFMFEPATDAEVKPSARLNLGPSRPIRLRFTPVGT